MAVVTTYELSRSSPVNYVDPLASSVSPSLWGVGGYPPFLLPQHREAALGAAWLWVLPHDRTLASMQEVLTLELGGTWTASPGNAGPSWAILRSQAARPWATRAS